MGIHNLFGKVQQNLLGLLLLQPDRSFYTNEIIELSQCGSGAVQRELKKLSSMGIINIQNLGNQKRYQANKNSPIFYELRTIILKTFGLADVIRQALFIREMQIRIAFIYGSTPKHTDTLQSDIDLMLISDSLSYADVFQQLEVANIKLGRTINPSIYSVEQWQNKLKRDNHFLKNVMENQKIFIIGNESELRKLSSVG